MSENPRVALGANNPPLETAERLPKVLETEHADLLTTASSLELERFGLPETLETDEHCATVSKFIADVKKAANGAEAKRKDAGKPYLDAQRAVKEWFDDIFADLEKQAETLTRAVGIYNKAKAERERAERLAREAEQRRVAEEARRQEQLRLQEAADAAKRAEEAAARIRQAATDAEREQAAADMRKADTEADVARDQAEKVSETAAKAERKADGHERAAEGDTTKLSRIAGAGATSSVSDKWTFTVTDWPALRATLGPLGPHLDNGVIETTLARVIRQQSAGGAVPSFQLAGVDVHTELKTNIRATRG